jgi:hypothetical protein
MQGKWIQRLTLGLAATALFVAAGGPSYAASTINGKNIKSKSISGSKLKSDTLTGTQIKESMLGTVPKATAADSATNAASVSDNAITSSKVANNSLTGADVSLKSGTLASYDAPSVAANSCVEDIVDLDPANTNMTDAVVAVTVEDSWPTGLSVTPENSNSSGLVRLDLCNPTGGAVNPAAQPLHWIAFTP